MERNRFIRFFLRGLFCIYLLADVSASVIKAAEHVPGKLKPFRVFRNR